MNDENLIPLNKRSKEEAKKIQDAGGEATKKMYAEKRKMKEILETLLSLPAEDIELNCSKKEAMLLKAIQNAEKGDLKSIEFIRDTIAEKPKEQMQIEVDRPIIYDDIENGNKTN